MAFLQAKAASELPSLEDSTRKSTIRTIPKITTLSRLLCKLCFVGWLYTANVLSQSYLPSQTPQSDQTQYSTQIDCTDPRNSSACAQYPAPADVPGSTDPYGNGNRSPRGQGSTDANGNPSRRSDLQGDYPAYSDDGGMDNGTATGRNRNSRSSQTSEPPEPLTEFQRLVEASTGRILPIFGRELFRSVPSTFAPVDQIPITSDYTIGPGDELLVRIWGQVTFNNRLTVDRTGSIYLPQVGAVHVAGLTYSELEAHLRAEVGRVFRNFQLTVNLGQLRSIQVFVVGQVRHPGNYTVSSFSTLINAIFTAGGPQSRGSLRHILLKRQGSTISDFDFYDLLLQGDKTKDSRLQSGDVIFVPPVGPQVAVAGSVRNPAIYELKDATSLEQMLQMAGGLSTTASSLRLSLERINERRVREATSISLDTAGRGTPLQDGDVVRVVPLSPRYEKSVTIRGNLANPGRFEWHTGMRLSELIPDRESLLTNRYWEKRNQLGSPSPFFADPQVNSARPVLQQGQPSLPSGEEGINSSIAGSRSRVTTGNGAAPPNTSAPSSTPSTSRYSNNTDEYANPQIVPTTVEVKIPAAEIDWSYAVIERLNPETLKSLLVPFNLGKLVMDHDTTQDLELQPGDIVTIFSQADIRVPLAMQTKYVRLEGEFGGAGVYSVMPGETLRELVRRAGGLSNHAYLYGSDFTRESTRVIQQRRLDEYISSLSIQVERDSSSRAVAVGSAQDAALAGGALAGQRELVARLRLLRATGRIILELKANSAGVDALPDLQLEDGDSFVVPSPPDYVNVVGAVYDQGSFLFNRSRRVHDYLKLAGGFTRSGDAKRAFIVRADGSVLSRQSAGTLWGNNFDSVSLNPGDTVVAPEKLLRLSPLRGLQDISQIFAQLALSAASIQVISR